VGPLDRCGIWSLVNQPVARVAPREKPATGDQPRTVASTGRPDVLLELPCNLADRRESDLRPDAGLPERQSHLPAHSACRPIWYYLLASAFLLTCWEWFLYQRRWID